MFNTNTTANKISEIGASANNYHPDFFGSDGENGVTVTKLLHKKVYENVKMMHIYNFNHYTFSTDNMFTNKHILNPFLQSGLDLSNRYEINRIGDFYHIQKINGKGKVFRFTLHVSISNGKFKYRYVWKRKIHNFIDAQRVKMRMYSAHQLGINLLKVYETKAV